MAYRYALCTLRVCIPSPGNAYESQMIHTLSQKTETPSESLSPWRNLIAPIRTVGDSAALGINGKVERPFEIEIVVRHSHYCSPYCSTEWSWNNSFATCRLVGLKIERFAARNVAIVCIFSEILAPNLHAFNILFHDGFLGNCARSASFYNNLKSDYVVGIKNSSCLFNSYLKKTKQKLKSRGTIQQKDVSQLVRCLRN